MSVYEWLTQYFTFPTKNSGTWGWGERGPVDGEGLNVCVWVCGAMYWLGGWALDAAVRWPTYTELPPPEHRRTHTHTYTCLWTNTHHPLETEGCFGPISDSNVFQELWEMRWEVLCVRVCTCVCFMFLYLGGNFNLNAHWPIGGEIEVPMGREAFWGLRCGLWSG